MNDLVIFINTIEKKCGVYQYGIRVYDIIKSSQQYNFKYYEIQTEAEYNRVINENPAAVAYIYNYHQTPMDWLTPHNIQRRVKNIGIIHESPAHLFDVTVDPDPNSNETVRNFGLPRPIYNNFDLASYTPSSDAIRNFIDIGKGSFIVGSFGFGFLNKGFQRIIAHVNETYDEAVIKFVIPQAFYSHPSQYHDAMDACRRIITKPGIQLHITNDFFSNEDILAFLTTNSVNMFLYDQMYGRGISSATDYAMSVNTPFLISDSVMFRHIYNDNICPYKTPMDQCIEFSSMYIKQLKSDNSHEKMIAKMNRIISAVVTLQ